MNLKLLLINALDTATLSASPELVSTLPVTHLQLSRRDAVARSTSTADQTLTATWDLGQAIDCIALYGHNLTVGGTWRVRLYARADGRGDPLYDSTAQPALLAKTLGEMAWGVDPLGMAWPTGGAPPLAVVWLSAPVTEVRHARMDWSEPGATSGYFEAQRWYLGRSFTPTVNANWEAQLSYRDDSTFLRSALGSLFIEVGARYRQLDFTLEWLTGAERLELGSTLAQIGKAADVLVSLYPGDPSAHSRQYTLAARLTDLPEFVVWRPDTYRATFRFVEI